MPTIPLTNRIHTTTAQVPTANLGSALANSDRASYSVQDLADTITLGAYLPLAGGTMTGDLGLNDDVYLKIGSATGGDLQIYHNASHSLISNQTGNLFIRNQTDDGDILLQADDGSGGDTTYIALDGGVGFTYAHKKIRFTGETTAAFGDSDDLRIYHDSNSYIENDTNDLIIKNTSPNKDMVLQCDDGTGTGVLTYLRLDGDDLSVNIETIILMMPNLPTTDPAVTGQVWNDSGTLKIS